MPAKALAADFDADGIRGNCVAPSIVDTPMSHADLWLTGKGFEGKPFPVHRPEEMAAAAISPRTWHEVSTARLTHWISAPWPGPPSPRDGGAVPVPCAGRAASSSRRDGTSGRVPRHNGRVPRRR
ncbi:hypothetical protein OK006_9415 [Actinobacteria bacterium OK006]|nr:hypothetical protein OK006_9415 [Actinobacteria bacterium OK006]